MSMRSFDNNNYLAISVNYHSIHLSMIDYPQKYLLMVQHQSNTHKKVTVDAVPINSDVNPRILSPTVKSSK